MLHFKDTQIEWEVEGKLAVLGWRDQASGAYQCLGRLWDGANRANSGTSLETSLTLWIGHDVKDVLRKVVGINLPLRARSSKGKKARDVSVVLPIAGANLEVMDSAHEGNLMLGNLIQSVHDVRFAFALDAAPYAVMPVPRRPLQKPLDDSPGHIMMCIQSLTRVKHVDVHVAKSSDADRVLRAMAEAAKEASLQDLPINVETPDCLGMTGAINRWDLYPVTADDWTKARNTWNPYVDDAPPAYTECGLPSGYNRPSFVSSPKNPTSCASSDEKIEWYIPPTPKKRKASDSPPRRREAVCKSRLDELDQEATELACTEEVLEWAGTVNAAAGAQRSSACISTANSLDEDLQRYQSTETFTYPVTCAPNTSMALTSLRRTELTKANAIFFDMVSLLQRALQCDTRAHETYLSDLLYLGLTARLAVHELTHESGTCTPAQDQTHANFVAVRDGLAKRLITDAAKKDPSNTWDTAPFPRDPTQQVEYVRCWFNKHLQVNADMDMFDELINMAKAAARLKQLHGFCVFDSQDPSCYEFEFVRAACFATAFYRLGGHPVMKGRIERSPSLIGRDG